MPEFQTEVLDIIQRTHNVKSFRLKTEEGAEFTAGQWFLFTIDVGGRGATKPFSFSNSPTEKDYIEFTKRLTTSDFSQALDRLEIGSTAKIKMPYGSFTLQGDLGKIAFLSGGIGITPIRSICQYVADRALAIDIVLLYGNNEERDIVFREDLDKIQRENNNIRVVHTLICDPADKDGCIGRVGLIDDSMIKDDIPDYGQRTFYVCGPPAMVSSMQDILKNKLHIKDNCIKLENFKGY